jgi:hypothetical protein
MEKGNGDEAKFVPIPPATFACKKTESETFTHPTRSAYASILMIYGTQH